MKSKTNFAPYALSANAVKKKVLEVKQFLGVDYSPAEINVATFRAVDMANVIFKDRVNQKRNGWEQLFAFEPIEYYTSNYVKKTNTTNINGVWSFFDSNKNKRVIAHVGKLLFEITGIGKGLNFLEFEATPITYDATVNQTTIHNVTKYELNDAKSAAFSGNGKLYILDGNKYYVLRVVGNTFDLSLVEDDYETYIPMTTIGITYKDSPVSQRTALDDVNLMSSWRKNKLVSGTYLDDGVSLRTTRFWDWELDTAIVPKTTDDLKNITVEVSYYGRW